MDPPAGSTALLLCSSPFQQCNSIVFPSALHSAHLRGRTPTRRGQPCRAQTSWWRSTAAQGGTTTTPFSLKLRGREQKEPGHLLNGWLPSSQTTPEHLSPAKFCDDLVAVECNVFGFVRGLGAPTASMNQRQGQRKKSFLCPCLLGYPKLSHFQGSQGTGPSATALALPSWSWDNTFLVQLHCLPNHCSSPSFQMQKGVAGDPAAVLPIVGRLRQHHEAGQRHRAGHLVHGSVATTCLHFARFGPTDQLSWCGVLRR